MPVQIPTPNNIIFELNFWTNCRKTCPIQMFWCDNQEALATLYTIKKVSTKNVELESNYQVNTYIAEVMH